MVISLQILTQFWRGGRITSLSYWMYHTWFSDGKEMEMYNSWNIYTWN
jgi:hypothetical protein